MTQLIGHARLAREYWQTYRPQALAELGSPLDQERYFQTLGSRVREMIGDLADEMLLEIPAEQRAQARSAVRAQAREVVYAQEMYLPKEAGTEHREM